VLLLLRSLVARVEALEQGHDWQYIVHCHHCELVGEFSTLELANEWVETHSKEPAKPKGSGLFHVPYVMPVVKR